MAQAKPGKAQGHKVIVVGGGGAGKSALTQMFMYNNFVEEYDPTTADSYRKMIEIENQKCQLDILDTAGQEEYMRDNYYRLGEGFLIVYSITMRDTFRSVNRFYDHIVSVKGKEDVPVVLVGSKCDLEAQRQVSTEDGKELASKLGPSPGCPFFETSAKTRAHVDDAFITLLSQVIHHKKQQLQTQPNTNSGCCVLS